LGLPLFSARIIPMRAQPTMARPQYLFRNDAARTGCRRRLADGSQMVSDDDRYNAPPQPPLWMWLDGGPAPIAPRCAARQDGARLRVRALPAPDLGWWV